MPDPQITQATTVVRERYQEETGELSAFLIVSTEMANQNAGYTVDEALMSMGFGKFQLLVCFYAGMGWLTEAMEMMILSFIGPAVKSKWNLSTNQETLLSVVVFAGMLVGAYSWGAVADKLGRRKGFLVTALVTSAAGLLSAFAWNFVALLVSRTLVGIGLGGGPVLFAWFMEFVPATNRGMWMIIFYGFWTVGTIFEVSLAWIVMPRLGWRWLVGISALPSFFLLVLYPLTPESPRYLCVKGKKNDALRIMEKIAELNKKELPSGMLITDHEREQQGEIIVPECAAPGSPSSTPPRWKDADMGAIRTLLLLLSPKLIRTTLLLWTIFIANAFSYYGLVLLTTQLNRTDRCNSNAPQSEDSSDGGVDYKNVFITTLAECPGLIIVGVFVDRIGRKISMAGLFFICIGFMLPLVSHQSPLFTTILLFGARICITGTFAVAFLIAPELYPTSVRSTGLGLASAMERIGGMICPYVAVGMMEGCHQREALLLFVGVVVVALVATLLIPYDTKGRALTESISSMKTIKQKEEA
ncbi:Organic cation/carnitine transporter 7 [Linum perenne]